MRIVIVSTLLREILPVVVDSVSGGKVLSDSHRHYLVFGDASRPTASDKSKCRSKLLAMGGHRIPFGVHPENSGTRVLFGVVSSRSLFQKLVEHTV